MARGRLVLRIAALVALLLTGLFYPEVLGLYVFSDDGVTILSPEDLGLRFPYALLGAWLGLSLTTSVVVLARGRGGAMARWLGLGTGLVGAAFLFVLLREVTVAFADGVPLPNVPAASAARALARIVQIALTLSLAWMLVDIGSRIRRLLPGGTAPRLPDRERTSRLGELSRAGGRELRELYDFYLDTTARSRLAAMKPVAKAFYLPFWLARSLFLKLTPARRVLLLTAVLIPRGTIELGRFSLSFSGLGFALLLLILVLELKDKLLAHDELEAGRAVQRALLPDTAPEVPGWDVWLHTSPAREVGGDLVDCLELPDERFGIAVGDVAGKGLGAAMLGAKIQATLRALAPRYDAPGELADELNLTLCRDRVRSRFVTLFYAELTKDGGRARSVSAGHPPPLVVRSGQVEERPRGGPALGLIEDTRFEAQDFDLGPGDLLLVYSDGVTEAMNDVGDLFGDERLRALAPTLDASTSSAAGERILAEVEAFVGDEAPSDDLTLAIVRRLPLE